MPAPRASQSAAGETWTTRQLLAWIGERFRERDLDSPRLAAEMLLSHVFSCPRLSLYTDPDRPASQAERDRLRELVSRALRHEPIQYLVGEAWFFGLPLHVEPAVLVPRPSTESLVEAALTWLRREPIGDEAKRDDGAHEEEGVATQQQGGEEQSDGAEPQVTEAAGEQEGASPMRVADIGTGSGAIAVALAANRPHVKVVATDISEEALAVARRNAERHGVADRIDFRQGDLFTPLAGDEPLDLIVSNPPYIPDHEWAAVAANVREHEPAGALRAGSDGLDVLRPLLAAAPRHLIPGGLLLVEHAASHAADVRRLAEATGELVAVETVDDMEKHPRFLRAQRA